MNKEIIQKSSQMNRKHSFEEWQTIIKYSKDELAKLKGYSNWNEFYNWVAREGERSEVVAQQIESAMEEVWLYQKGFIK